MKEFRTCPTCGYGRGFHLSFEGDGDSFFLILICPDCGASFNLNLKFPGLTSLEPETGPTY